MYHYFANQEENNNCKYKRVDCSNITLQYWQDSEPLKLKFFWWIALCNYGLFNFTCTPLLKSLRIHESWINAKDLIVWIFQVFYYQTYRSNTFFLYRQPIEGMSMFATELIKINLFLWHIISMNQHLTIILLPRVQYIVKVYRYLTSCSKVLNWEDIFQ